MDNDEFVEISLKKDALSAICPECLSTCVQHVATQTRMAHCDHKLSGFYSVDGQPFKVIPGIERSVFKDLMRRVCVAAEIKVDIAHAIVELAKQAADATKH